MCIMDMEAFEFTYVEKKGPFQDSARAAWIELFGFIECIPQSNIRFQTGLRYVDSALEGDSKYVYQAGLSLIDNSQECNGNLQKRVNRSGRFAKFTLTGPYSQITEAYALAMSVIGKNNLVIRNEFCMQRYVNKNVPESELLTDIYIPVAQ